MVDSQAEDAIRNTMENLKSKGSPLNSVTVVDGAIKRLNATGVADAPERVRKSIDEMVNRGELSASSEPWVDWTLT